jgi:hypothetical protein
LSIAQYQKPKSSKTWVAWFWFLLYIFKRLKIRKTLPFLIQLFCFSIILIQPLFVYSNTYISKIEAYDICEQESDTPDIDETAFDLPQKTELVTLAKTVKLNLNTKDWGCSFFILRPPTPPPDFILSF